MPYYFALIKDNVVVDISSVADGVIDKATGSTPEKTGQDFLADLWGHAPYEYVQCFETLERGGYPGIGYLWDGVEFKSPVTPEPVTSSPVLVSKG